MDKKQPIKVKNPTNCFIPGKDKTNLVLSSPDSYKAKRVKQLGYENRLYYEYKYCEDNNGQTFFFTLTYCDAKVPKYLGQNCFDYFDLVQLLNGGFKKKLERSYGTKFKYFVSAELGEGKGKRGIENNPHYHILFFLRPDTSKNAKPYVKIVPEDFRHLLRLYWQGFDQDVKWYDYRKSKFGIVKEGKYGISVTSFHACSYVAKYVTKDIRLVKRESVIRKYLKEKYYKKYNKDNVNCLYDFLRVEYPNYDKEYPFEGNAYQVWQDLENLGLVKRFIDYCKRVVDSLVEFDITEYRNRYCNKVRISQGVGDYAMNFLEIKEEVPFIKIPTKQGFQMRPINLYYYRKLFTDVVKDNNGNNVRILNSAGIEYRVKRLDKQVKSLALETESKVKALDESLYIKMVLSDINEEVRLSFVEFQQLYKSVNINDLFERYAIYKLVYENRLTSIGYDRSTGIAEFPIINVFDDFRRFLKSSVLASNFNYMSADYLSSVSCEGFIHYSAHPYFRSYVRLFSVFDLLTDYLFVQTDNKKEDEAKEREKVRRYFIRNNIKQYVNLNF